MIQTKIQSEKKKKKGNNSKTKVAELWFFCTALLHNVFYQCMQFQVDSFYGLEVTAWTKIQSEKMAISDIRGR